MFRLRNMKINFLVCTLSYREKIENVLVRNWEPDLIVIWQKLSLDDPLPRLLKLFWFIRNMICQGVGQVFLIHNHGRKFSGLFLNSDMLLSNKWITKPLIRLYLCCSQRRVFFPHLLYLLDVISTEILYTDTYMYPFPNYFPCWSNKSMYLETLFP